MKNIFSFLRIGIICSVMIGLVNPGFAKEENMTLTLKSSAFVHEGEIPRKYTCQGEDISPDLEWDGVPEGAVSLVLIADDPDAPDPAAPKMTWVHWIVYNIPPETTGFVEAFSPKIFRWGWKMASMIGEEWAMAARVLLLDGTGIILNCTLLIRS